MNNPPIATKQRLDLLLVARGLFPSRQQAQAAILAGELRVNGRPAGKAGVPVPIDSQIEIHGSAPRYASRGGLKLEGALEDFHIEVGGTICMDIGSSNGGFTDCLLQHGAARVHAVDVTISQLDWKLRQDPRVRTVECNARYLRPEDIGELADIITLDVSFISVGKVFPAAVRIATAGAAFLILVKPQFELERGDVGKGGIVRDPAMHQRAIQNVWQAAEQAGLQPQQSLPSRLTGAGGNQEFFLLAHRA
jgi:23S rRNA (cytidine1920-2'-O)/16S rRNA (cytidine1409-2'-O)-methyltransferase